MPMYRKKPVTLEAVQVTWPDGTQVNPPWLTKAIGEGTVYWQGGDDPHYSIETLEGVMRANIFDWLIQGVKGEIYPCKPDIFAELYEAV